MRVLKFSNRLVLDVTALAGLRKLKSRKQTNSDARVVAILTGHVLKDTDCIIEQHQYATKVTATAELSKMAFKLMLQAMPHL